jgi:hypothetical protein
MARLGIAGGRGGMGTDSISIPRSIVDSYEELKSWPDEKISSELEIPTGIAPSYLVFSEAKRREFMRKRYEGELAKQDKPQVSMLEEILSGSGEGPLPPGVSLPGGIAGGGGPPPMNPMMGPNSMMSGPPPMNPMMGPNSMMSGPPPMGPAIPMGIGQAMPPGLPMMPQGEAGVLPPVGMRGGGIVPVRGFKEEGLVEDESEYWNPETGYQFGAMARDALVPEGPMEWLATGATAVPVAGWGLGGALKGGKALWKLGKTIPEAIKASKAYRSGLSGVGKLATSGKPPIPTIPGLTPSMSLEIAGRKALDPLFTKKMAAFLGGGSYLAGSKLLGGDSPENQGGTPTMQFDKNPPVTHDATGTEIGNNGRGRPPEEPIVEESAYEKFLNAEFSRKPDKGLAMMAAGAAMMSSQSPHFLSAIGAGGTAYVNALTTDGQRINQDQLKAAGMLAQRDTSLDIQDSRSIVKNRNLALDEIARQQEQVSDFSFEYLKMDPRERKALLKSLGLPETSTLYQATRAFERFNQGGTKFRDPLGTPN